MHIVTGHSAYFSLCVSVAGLLHQFGVSLTAELRLTNEQQDKEPHFKLQSALNY